MSIFVKLANAWLNVERTKGFVAVRHMTEQMSRLWIYR